MGIARRAAATILVPVDFDDASRHAVAAAVALASRVRARLVILHVIPPTSLPEGMRVLPLDEADRINLAEYVSPSAGKLLEMHSTSALIAGLAVRTEARTGHPADTILRAIAEDGAKLVIMGTHGRAGFARVALGSVAESVLRRSPVPVMTVRAPEPVAEYPREAAFASAPPP